MVTSSAELVRTNRNPPVHSAPLPAPASGHPGAGRVSEPPRSAVVVRLELAARQHEELEGDGVPSLRPEQVGPHLSGGARPGRIDHERLARAVGDLIRAIDPSLADGIRVEVTQVPADEPARSPRPLPVPAVQSAPAPDPAAGAPDTPDTDDIRLDLLGRTLHVDGEHVTLTRREFDLLAYLLSRRGAALGRRELMNAVWQTGYLVGDRTIDVHVRRLRVKLGSQADRLRTLRGYGYRLD